MIIKQQTELSLEDKEQVFKLWNHEYPEKLQHKTIKDFDDYLNSLTQQVHYLLLNGDSKIEGWVTTFVREDEKWFAIILSEKLHGKGLGTQMLNKLKENEDALNGWVIDQNSDRKLNGSLYQSPLEFYQKNNFQVIPEIRLETISAVKIRWKKSNG
ncbi:GNAT family N-acetyltransferase [Siphonobacter sp. SORGH_AS_0500]|uniref:GNAT family N-acetyltransferase n=1 Tax=Siphonobacter sp. SORGH_AS_0500 TaxID=1864824 RepID=UPI002854EC6D|nr:GNAT family N-acetyltransferase [Siphonobacter sp. SORGH_AS_0500]MDR6195298.1 GNAT superfamily N-acetyltransferase [Siphonobacter sp. SORGH_AS_0500]